MASLCLLASALALAGSASAKYNATGYGDLDFNGNKSLSAKTLWGAGSSSFHFEGGSDADGKGESIWDVWFQDEKHAVNDSGKDAIKSYEMWQDDIDLLENIGAEAYRLSISWPRVLPDGKNTTINEKGLDYYKNLVAGLKKKKLTVYVTLYHWDLPQALQKEYEGFMNETELAHDFEGYARVMFEALGEQVDYWTTFNDPRTMCAFGYGKGYHAPGLKETDGQWKCARTVLIAHGHAVKVFRELAQEKKVTGKIGLTLSCDWGAPYSEQDEAAAERFMAFTTGLFAEPVYTGKWPEAVQTQLGEDRLKAFTTEESEMLKGSVDYFGMSHWSSHWIKDKEGKPEPDDDSGNVDQPEKGPDGEPIGADSGVSWMKLAPWGLRNVLNYIHDKYEKPEIHILECGVAVEGEPNLKGDEALEDTFRSDWLTKYILEVAKAVKLDEVDVKSFIVWALADNFEWGDGYQNRFGLATVDFEGTYKRTPKKSAGIIRDYFKELRGSA